MEVARKMMLKREKHRETESPWERDSKPAPNSPDGRKHCLKHGFSSICYKNKYLDIKTKRAATKSSPSVVSLVTYSDDKELWQGTGTIIEEDGTVLTSAQLFKGLARENVVAKNLKVSRMVLCFWVIVYIWDGKSYEARLLAHDFYYNVAVIKIQEFVPQLKPACLRLIDDCLSIDPSELCIDNDNGCKLCPGDNVIAIGRYFIKPYDLMAAPGEFSIKRYDNQYGCKELFVATCLIRETGIGGPLINDHGEVIGVNWYGLSYTPFLPINIALKWWEHHKKYGTPLQRHLLGMELANFYSTNLLVMEKIILKFPNNVAGAIVENVKQGSSAYNAGICPNDLIVECCGKQVRSFLELFDMLSDNTGTSVVLVVLRFGDAGRLQFSLDVADPTE